MTQELAYKALVSESLSEVYKGEDEIKEVSDGLIKSFAVFEVVSIRDIGKRQDDTSNTHTYLLVLFDGTSEIQAFEYSPWDVSLSIGCKVVLIPNFQVKRGLFLLNSNNIMLLTTPTE